MSWFVIDNGKAAINRSAVSRAVVEHVVKEGSDEWEVRIETSAGLYFVYSRHISEEAALEWLGSLKTAATYSPNTNGVLSEVNSHLLVLFDGCDSMLVAPSGEQYAAVAIPIRELNPEKYLPLRTGTKAECEAFIQAVVMNWS